MQRPGLYPFYDLHDPNVSSSLEHGVRAAVNLSLPHTTSILLVRNKYTVIHSHHGAAEDSDLLRC